MKGKNSISATDERIENITAMTDQEVGIALQKYGMEPLTRLPEVLRSLRPGTDRTVGATAKTYFGSVREFAGNLWAPEPITLLAATVLLLACLTAIVTSMTPPSPPNQPPVINSVIPSMSSVLRPCPPEQNSTSCTPTGSEVTLVAHATDVDSDQLLFTWSVTGGRLSGEGREVTWDLTGIQNGTYTASVEVDDGNMHKATGSATVTVADCRGCVAPPPLVSVNCTSEVDANQPITFNRSVLGGPERSDMDLQLVRLHRHYRQWQDTSTITIDTG